LLLAGKQIIYLELIYLSRLYAAWITPGYTQSSADGTALSGLGPPCPGLLKGAGFPSLWFRKPSFLPTSDDFLLSFSNYLLLLIWNLNIWEA
jgi:hypothetical protein